MAGPSIGFYASPASSVCAASHPFPHNSHVSHDFEISSRSSSSSSGSTASSQMQKPVVGGLSSLFASSSVKHGSIYSTGGEELGSFRHDKGEDLGNSFGYLHYPSFSSSLKRDQSPVSVFQGPVSCSSSFVGTARSPSTRTSRDRHGDAHLSSPFRCGSNGLFTGFVRSALSSSCIDYDSPSFEVLDDPNDVNSLHGVVDELTFNMEDNFMDAKVAPSVPKLLSDAQVKHKIFCDDLVVKAFYEAEKAHRGQFRASGAPYLQHCVETAVLLALIGANSTVVAAGILHDTLDDSFMSSDYILKTFGAEVTDLVEGVSKLSQLSKLARQNNTASKIDEVDRMHTMFLAMADPKAVLIKLADRLHNMMTLNALPFHKQQRFAKETQEIFAPLANRLGIYRWKEQLENLCFKHLNPEEHEDMTKKLVKSFDEALVAASVMKLEQALKDENVTYHVLSGRHKSLYSIYRKMQKKKLTMDEIHDIHGLRLIVDNDQDCYEALKVVRQLWTEVPGRLKDYITCPKFNGYQSLHTVVMGEDDVPFEVQIRTKEMHLQAEFGFASHWRYKEADCKHSSFVLQMVEWARWVVTWQCETMNKDWGSISYGDSSMPHCSFPFHAENCPHSYKSPCDHDGPVFVIMMENDKMSVQEFPANSTMMDLLERAGRGSSKWTPYRFPIKELRPRLNHEPVTDPTCKLKMGDVIELTPAISDKSLTKYREEIQRMYDSGLTLSTN